MCDRAKMILKRFSTSVALVFVTDGCTCMNCTRASSLHSVINLCQYCVGLYICRVTHIAIQILPWLAWKIQMTYWKQRNQGKIINQTELQ